MFNGKEPIYIIDGTALIFRGFHAAREYMLNSKDQDVSAINTTISSLVNLLRTNMPDHVALVFDPAGGSFRSQIYAAYKTNRSVPDPQLIAQIPVILDLLRYMGFPVFCVPGYEADDVIGTIAKHYSAQGHEVSIESRDKDFVQLIDDNISIVDSVKDTILNKYNGHEKFGVPLQYSIDFLAICGDNVDNIPGVKQVGENSAAALINLYGGLDDIYRNIDNGTFTHKIGNKKPETIEKRLEEARDDAYMSYKLATIKTDIDMGDTIALEQLEMREVNLEALLDLVESWELHRIRDNLLNGRYDFLKDSVQVANQLNTMAQTRPAVKRVSARALDKSSSKTAQPVQKRQVKGEAGLKYEEIYKLTDEDISLQHSYAPLPGEHAKFFSTTRCYPMVELKHYLQTTQLDPVLEKLVATLAAQVEDEIARQTPLALALAKNKSKPITLDLEQLGQLANDYLASLIGSDPAFPTGEVSDLKALFKGDTQASVRRWLNALAPMRENLKVLLPHALSVSLNLQRHNFTEQPLYVGLTLMTRSPSSTGELQVTPEMSQEKLMRQLPLTSCFSFSIDHGSAWDELHLSATDFLAFFHVFRELLVKPLFLGSNPDATTLAQCARLGDTTHHPIELLDPELALPLPAHTLVFTNALQYVLDSLDFSAGQAVAIGKHVHDMELIGYCRNTAHRDTSIPGLAQGHLNLELGPTSYTKTTTSLAEVITTHERACLFMPYMGVMFAQVMEKPLYKDIEHQLYKYLYHMHKAGIHLDVNKLREIEAQLLEQIEETQQAMYAAAGCEFNAKSTKQTAEILYDVLSLPDNSKRSTAAEVISLLDHPVIEHILQYRSLTTILATHVQSLIGGVIEQTDGSHLITTNFSQTQTVTGRLSSYNPNLQNVPSRGDIAAQIRSCFISQPGYTMVSFDYSQVELRVSGHLSQETHMVQAFAEGKDIHAETAAKIFKVALDQVTKSQRQIAKAINFGLNYGKTAFSLANELGIERSDAKEYIDEYFGSYPQIKTFIAQTIGRAIITKFVSTLHGRVIPLPNIDSKIRMAAESEKRNATNYPIQGSAAEIMKLAMVKLHQVLIAEMPEVIPHLQIHDELLFSIPDHLVESYIPRIQKIMETCISFPTLQLKVDYNAGKCWTK